MIFLANSGKISKSFIYSAHLYYFLQFLSVVSIVLEFFFRTKLISVCFLASSYDSGDCFICSISSITLFYLSVKSLVIVLNVNPCFNGICSLIVSCSSQYRWNMYCLNPCFNGICSLIALKNYLNSMLDLS